MKYTVEAMILSNGMKMTTKVDAANSSEAELIAGRKFLETGIKSDNIKIVHIDGQVA